MGVGTVIVGLKRDADELPSVPSNHGNLDAILIIQTHFQHIQVAWRKLRGEHLPECRLVADGRQPCERNDAFAGLNSQGVAPLPDLSPIMLFLKSDSVRHSQRRRTHRVSPATRANPRKATRRAAPFPPPTYNQWLEPRLDLTPRMQKSCALRRAEPFVTRADIDIRSDCSYIKRDLPRRMRAVNNGQDAMLPSPAADLFDGKDHRGRTGDVRDKYHPVWALTPFQKCSTKSDDANKGSGIGRWMSFASTWPQI